MSQQEIVSLEQFETMNRTSTKAPTRKYVLMLWDRDKDNTPCWTSEAFLFRPEDLIEKKTTAALMLRNTLAALARNRDIKNLSCLMSTGSAQFAKPIVKGYYRHLIDDVLAQIAPVKKQKEAKTE